MTDDITAKGDRSVAARSISHSNINTGNVYNIYAAAPAPLAGFIRTKQFSNLVEERTRNFVGREFIFRAIDEHLRRPEFHSGYITITGEPGIGKTSIIAKLIQQHGYVHHFNIAHQLISSTEAFLKNVCAQLIVRYSLNHTMLPLPDAANDSGFLSGLLAEAVDKSNETIIVLVDALDEAEDPPPPATANRLLLPPSLPERVFFIVTTREKHHYQFKVDHQENIYINDNDPHNIADVQTYIRRFLEQHQVQMNRAVSQWGVSEEDFVNVITDKSEGNFMYLVYVLSDIRDEKLNSITIDCLQNLPKGLRSYYEHHWTRMKIEDGEAFKNLYEPVVCALAAAHEPITLSRLAEWTKLTYADLIRVVREWREFLNKYESEAGEDFYRIYHSSFRDFLHNEVDFRQYNNMIASSIDDKVQSDDDQDQNPL